MGLLVKTSPLSIRRRSSKKKDGGGVRRNIDQSVLDSNTIDTLVCEVHHRDDKFPSVEKNCDRSKKRWKKKKKSRTASETKASPHGRHGYHKRSQGMTRCIDFDSQRTFPLSDASDCESLTVTSEMTTPNDSRYVQNDIIVAMTDAFECVARVDHNFSGDNEDDREDDEEDGNKKNRFNGRLSIFSKDKTASKSSHSSFSSTFSRIIGKLASISRNNGLDDEKATKCRDEGKEGRERSRESYILDLDVEQNNAVEGGEIEGTSRDSPRGKMSDSIFKFNSNAKDEELDPIFVSGLNIYESDSENSSMPSISLVDGIDDKLSDSDESVLDNEASQNTGSGANISGREVSSIEQTSVTKPRSLSTTPVPLWIRNDNKRNELALIRCAAPNRRQPTGLPIARKDRRKVVEGKNESQNVKQTVGTKPRSPSTNPTPLWVRNHDKRNELAWIRCAARNRRRPTEFPIAQKRRTQVVEGKDESHNADTVFFPWLFSCGEVFGS